MQLHKTSLLVRIAYVFKGQDQIPAQVDRCTLWQRFCAMLIPWFLLNIVIWIGFGLIMGVLAQCIWRPIVAVCVGKKLVMVRDIESESSKCPIVCSKALARITVFSYAHENIRWLDWCVVYDVHSPLLTIFISCSAIGMFYLGLRSMPTLFREIGGYLAYAGSGIYHTAGWWGTPVIAAMALFALWYILGRGYKAFASTPSGNVIVSHIKAWKEQHCTIIELV